MLTNELKRTKPIRVRSEPAVKDWQKALLWVGGVCVAVGVLPFLVVNYHNFQVILSQGYSGYYSEGARLESPLLSLKYLFITGLVFVGCAGRVRYRHVATAMLIAVALLRLAAGDRGEGMIYLLAGYLVHRQFTPSTKRSRIGVVLIVLLTLIMVPAIGLLRQSFGEEGGSNLVQVIQQENPLVGTLSTTGVTMFPLIKVIELAPGDVPFAGGATYLTSVALLVPDILSVGPLGDLAANPVYVSPGKWLMDYLGMSSGPGFTPFAEAYLNFGWWGGCLAMLVFGALFTLLLRLPDKTSSAWPLKMAIALTTFALVGFSVRGSFNFVVPSLVYFVFIPGFAVVLTANRFRKARGRHEQGS